MCEKGFNNPRIVDFIKIIGKNPIFYPVLSGKEVSGRNPAEAPIQDV